MLGAQPPSLNIRVGPAVAPGVVDHNAAVARLLTVLDPRTGDPNLGALLGPGHRIYREARIEPGDVVTLVGFVEPFDQLPDPAAADDSTLGDGLDGDPTTDPAIAADLAAARASGELAESPVDAWGNAAIPGFGIGRPTRQPHLDAGARALPVADEATAERIERTFTIGPQDLVVAATTDAPLLVTLGGPSQAAAREDSRFLVGLVGAVIAIVSATAGALALTGGLAS